MDFNDIFEAYYTLYRAEADTPAGAGVASSARDDEYTIGIRFANAAVRRWANYDGVYWKELFTTARLAGESPTIVTAVTTYDAPDDFREAGGFVKVLDSDLNTFRSIPIIEPQEAQFRSDNSTYAYFTGNPGEGYVLNINPTPDTAMVGKTLDYVYYKSPTEFTTGTDITEMANPDFIIQHMLGNRFRASRNPYYSSALRDAEEALKLMKLDNDSGSWSNPWKLADNSGSSWGA